MIADRRTLLALPLAAGIAPQALAQSRPAAASDIPFWPPAEYFPLWPGTPPGARQPLPRPAPEISGRPGGYRDILMRGVARPEVGVFRPLRPDGRAALVMPGGGYAYTSLRGEGMDVARALTPLGITVFVLSYRLPGEGWIDRADVPLADAQRAMRLLRANAARYGIRAETLGVLGFSAGGHLAGSLVVDHALPVYRPVDAADRQSTRPAYAGLMYAVSNMDAGRSIGGSRTNLLGPDPSPAVQARYAIDRRLQRGDPPLFLVHATDDTTVPVVNGLDLLAAARRAEIPVEAHILRRGGHGFGTRLPLRSPGSLWPHLFDRWMGEAVEG
jgi:acetyl esterase/lipase